MKITWLGHSAFRIETAKAKILIDPFLTHNPSFAGQDLKDVSAGITHILLTHGHGDHVGDTIALAKETGAVVLANADLAAWLGSKGVSKIEMGNTGGTDLARRLLGHLHQCAAFLRADHRGRRLARARQCQRPDAAFR